jgi:hypothetical protein
MGPRIAYKDMLDNVVSSIACVSMNHQNQLEKMANGAMFTTTSNLLNHTLHAAEKLHSWVLVLHRSDRWCAQVRPVITAAA